jgi:hypothetical protein
MWAPRSCPVEDHLHEALVLAERDGLAVADEREAADADVELLLLRPRSDDFDAWFHTATMPPGSWWPDWMAWLRAQGAEEVAAREVGGGGYAPIEDAPGSYVKVRS